MATANTKKATETTELPASSMNVANLSGEDKVIGACSDDDEATTKRKRRAPYPYLVRAAICAVESQTLKVSHVL